MIFNNLIFVGDIHGALNQISYHFNSNKIKNSLYIQLGDFGIGFKKQTSELNNLQLFNSNIKQKDNYLYTIRGNHDDPHYFSENFNCFTHIKLLKDYTILDINLNNKILKILFIGGATSIDRLDRKGYQTNGEMGMDWWKGEEFFFDETLLKSFENVDIVVTHTAPQICGHFTSDILQYYIKRDNALYGDIKLERELLDKTYDILKEKNNIKFWFYGHFHTYQNTIINQTNFICLNQNQFYEFKHP